MSFAPKIELNAKRKKKRRDVFAQLPRRKYFYFGDQNYVLKTSTYRALWKQCTALLLEFYTEIPLLIGNDTWEYTRHVCISAHIFCLCICIYIINQVNRVRYKTL